MRIVRLVDQPDCETVEAAIDDIFFEASGTKTFANAGDKAAFRQRWLGRYISDWPEHVWLAREAGSPIAGSMASPVAGYLIGCPIDPSRDPRFADIGYFGIFASACADFPAHLHINLAPAYRSRGLGGLLIDAFAGQARARGCPGLHVVTGANARNVGFYQRLGFQAVARTVWNANPIVFLGRRLSPIGS